MSTYFTCGIKSEAGPADPFFSIRPLVDAFNNNNKNNFVAGSSIEIDECTSAWRGKNARHRAAGAPGITMQKGKPEPVGLQFWNASDCSTGILLNLELNEGKLRNAQKDYRDRFPVQQALVLRLTQSYHGSLRQIYADSYFSSVSTAITCQQYGMHFSGIIKVAHLHSPKIEAFAELSPKEVQKGTSMFYTTTYPEKDSVGTGSHTRQLLAVAHKDVKLKLIVSTSD